jgi:mannan endo-1,4-beta-mannosidase
MSRVIRAAVLLIAGVVFISGCNGNSVSVDTPEPEPELEPEVIISWAETLPARWGAELFDVTPVDIIIPAAEAELFGSNARLSADGYLEGLESSSDYFVFTVNIPADGFYDLNFISGGIGGPKDNYISVNGERVGEVHVPEGDFTDSVFERAFLYEGLNTISVERHWGWIRLKSLHITDSQPLDPAIFEVSAKLINPDANETTRRLMSFLADAYGRVMLSGQYSDNGLFAGEAGVIFMTTDKRPAVLGLDMMDYTPSRVGRAADPKAIERAIEADEHGAIVTFCWHWNAPSEYIGENHTWYRAFYTDHTDINLGKILSGEDPEGYELLLRDIDAISDKLKLLQEADVPILWRPLHEAAGEWFWWGASGPQAQIDLWILMYERMTYQHGLNNLIWLWNGQGAEWYPGDEYVDIIGEDIYAGEHAYASQINRFTEAVNYTTPPKMVVLSENGTLIDPDLAFRDGAMWGFFATWGTEFVLQGRNIWRYSEQFTEEEMLLKVYNHERIITLDELPDLKTYPIRD